MKVQLAAGDERQLTLVEPSPATIEGRVLAGGGAVAHATLLVFSGQGSVPRTSATTDARGEWSVSLPAGRFGVLAVGPAGQPGRSRVASGTVGPGGVVVVDLAFGSASLAGLVTSSTGSLPEPVSVRLEPDGMTPSSPHGPLSARAVEGRFCFENLPAGTYRLSAHAHGALPGESVIVVLHEGQRLPDVGLTLTPTGSVHGIVVDARDVPVLDGCDVWLSSDASRRGTVTYEGRFELASLAAGTWRAEVFAPNRHTLLGSSAFVVERGVTTELRIVADDP